VLEALTAQLAEQEAEALLDADLAATACASAGGTRARRHHTADSPKGPWPRSTGSRPGKPSWVVIREAQASVALDHDRRRRHCRVPAALDGYVAALTRANQLGIDLVPFEINPTTISVADLDALASKLRTLIVQNEPPERLI
jgi:hypothetical protein